jgi:hypothetical protein
MLKNDTDIGVDKRRFNITKNDMAALGFRQVVRSSAD